MLPKFAVLLSPAVIGVNPAFRIGLVVNGTNVIGAIGKLAERIAFRLSELTRLTVPIGGHARQLVLQTALAPAHETLSLLSTTCKILLATSAGLVHLAPLYLIRLF